MLGSMHLAELTPAEQRVLGCLIEKRWTTPDQYPLSLNGLRLACNQSTNRDPVTAYDEAAVREAAQRLCLYGLARLASGHGSRAIKYRHLAEDALGLGREELSVLAVLLLRGPQTPGELKARTERMARLESLAEVELVLSTLAERGYARRLDRRAGQKEDRFEHLLGGTGAESPAPAGVQGPPAGVQPAPAGVQGPPAGVQSAPAGVQGPPAGVQSAPAGLQAASAEVQSAPAGAQTVSAGLRPVPYRMEATPAPAPTAAPEVNGGLADRVAALEAEVAGLRADLDELRGRQPAPARGHDPLAPGDRARAFTNDARAAGDEARPAGDEARAAGDEAPAPSGHAYG
jgi:uncharacterized protein